MQRLLEYILRTMLGEDSEFSVTRSEDEQGMVFILQIPEEERGKVIGKGGRNIKALRDVVSILAHAENKRVYLKVTD